MQVQKLQKSIKKVLLEPAIDAHHYTVPTLHSFKIENTRTLGARIKAEDVLISQSQWKFN